MSSNFNEKKKKMLIVGCYDCGKFQFDRSVNSGDIFMDPLGNVYKVAVIKENTITYAKLAMPGNSERFECSAVSRENFLAETDTSEYPNAWQPYEFIKVQLVED